MSVHITGISWYVRPFAELSLEELYALLHLRAEVFGIEQRILYNDPDYKDQTAHHMFAVSDGKMIAYSRLFPAGTYREEASMGRVLVDKSFRGKGIGKELVIKGLEFLRDVLHEKTVVISAQSYLQRFYEEQGFTRISDVYIEEEIEHVRMVAILI